MASVKTIQIDEDLFFALIRYHFAECEDEHDYIVNGLLAKLDKMIDHDLYTKSKTAHTEKEREQARQEYLKRRGINEDFKW